MPRDNPTVFVVDDDPSVRRSLARLIRSAGRNVETFPSATAFLREAPPPRRPGCLVLDVRMPGLSGLDLQTELAKAGLDLPIVFITGHGNIPMSVQAMKAGAVDFLQKPFDDQDLLTAIKEAIRRHYRASRFRSRREDIERRLESLTTRERQVLSFVVRGMKNKDIGLELGTTEKTVKVHRARVMRKMRARSLAELVRLTERLEPATPLH